MSKGRILWLVTSALVVASGAAGELRAQEVADRNACAQLLPAIESLKAMLALEAKARSAEVETQRMQLVMNLLGIRYRNIEALEASLRSVDTEDDDIRSAIVRARAQLDALDEAARNSPAPAPDPERKAQRAEIEANTKGLEERAKSLADRKSNYQGQLALERRDIDKLESFIRAWLEKAQ